MKALNSIPWRRIAALPLALPFAVFLHSLPVAAQTEMKLASATINDVQHEWQKRFKAGVEARAGDRLTVSIFPASQLGTIPRMLEGVLFGTIEGFITPTAFATGAVPKFKVFDAPGLFQDPAHLARVIHDPTYRDHIETMALDKGLRVIGAIFNSPFVVLTKAPAPKVADLDGLKIRTFASPLQIEPLAALGASPVPLPLSEVVPALQSGNIDGMLAGIPILTAFKYYDVATNVTELHFSQIVSVNLVNEDWFQAQPEDLQQIIREEGRKAERAVFDFGVANIARANDVWKENGGTILQLQDDDRAQMMALFAEVGGRLLREDEAVATEYERLLEVVQAKR